MSLIEVERKRALTDVAALTGRLRVQGYHEAATSVEVDTYYSRPDVDFLVTVECLRVRQRDGFAEITYKPASTGRTRSASGVIAKRETNVLLSGPEQAIAADELMTALGMVRLCRVEKTRTAFRNPEHDSVTVTVDRLAGVGSFVETEVMAVDEDAAARLLGQVERRLGLVDHAVVNLPYRDLVLQQERAATAE
ncbi:adenylate cyclase [Actinoplanes sp. SE50]|uniref:class IV adenylate cyclase n=1 Tax=unclassified Actinoplanes TaxID=2626549 RepID=UPI00023EC0E3|nr:MULTISPECIES: class IV adenylate cyclase [unclassified Actinoplanes]AEV84593.1 adenylate cyclase, class 2 [Actinoplanes sp. SE50/110]ATO82985.1 adenylate cyclase [Actinoplanes sp. SE50]SLM00393.1 adenylate cyclase [Actinoplanes sp. SE50/110]